MQTNRFLADDDDDPILWELCKTSAMMLTEKGKTRRGDVDAIEKHRTETEAEQDRFKKKKSSSSRSGGGGGNIMNRIKHAANNNNNAESRNDVPSSSDSRAAIMSFMPAATSTTPGATSATQEHEKRQRGGGWWRRGASTSSGETRDKPFSPPAWVTGKGGGGGKHYNGKGGDTSNAAPASHDSSGIVVGTPATPRSSLMPKTAAEARQDAEPAAAGVENADNWSLSESLGKLMNDTRQQKVVYRHFGPNPMQSLKVEQTGDMPIPEHDDHVVVKIMASTVTLNDCILRRGLDFSLATPISLPATPGQDFVGFIVSAGDNVTTRGRFKVGDRVAGLVRSGGNARFISVTENNLVPVPRNLDTSEAVCMVSIYAAAYQSVKAAVSSDVASLRGKKVLVIGGMDGTGQAIIQISRKAHADVYCTAPEHRHGYVQSTMGAIPLPENSAEWSLIAEGEMDYVFDGVCEDGLESSRKALNKDGGKLVCFGQGHLIQGAEMGYFGAPLSARYARFQNDFLMPNTARVDIWESFENNPELYKKHVMSLFQLLSWKKIKPQIAKKVGLIEAAGLSHEKLERGQVRGIVVCHPWRRLDKKKIARKAKKSP